MYAKLFVLLAIVGACLADPKPKPSGIGYAAPLLSYAPALSTYSTYHAPAVAYHAPAVAYHAPAISTYAAAPLLSTYAAAPIATTYHAPAVTKFATSVFPVASYVKKYSTFAAPISYSAVHAPAFSYAPSYYSSYLPSTYSTLSSGLYSSGLHAW